MIRVRDLEATLNFYCGILGMEVLRRTDYPDGRFTNTFIGYGPEAEFPTLDHPCAGPDEARHPRHRVLRRPGRLQGRAERIHREDENQLKDHTNGQDAATL
jgi:catechol 2,3-dioxygenase-like lactoylglutathione lyase family enzyme